jgi:hypothetical protein
MFIISEVNSEFDEFRTPILLRLKKDRAFFSFKDNTSLLAMRNSVIMRNVFIHIRSEGVDSMIVLRV